MATVAEELSHVTAGGQTFEIDPRYQQLRVIGSGAYGTVCAAVDVNTKRKVAIKKVRDLFRGRETGDAKRILREVKLLKHLGHHENVVWLLDAMASPLISGGRVNNFKDLYIVTDLMETDLAHIIESKQALSDAHLKYFIYQLCRALKFCHTSGVLHRDLKPANVLINSNCELVLADFGLARVTPVALSGAELPFSPPGPDDAEGMTTYVVTRWYRAPELLASAPQYTGAVDMWSVGCILAEMLGRKALFRGRSHTEQLQLLVTSIGVKGISEYIAGSPQAAAAAVAPEPTTRPSSAAAAATTFAAASSGSGGTDDVAAIGDWLRQLPAYKFIKSAALKNGGKPLVRDWKSVYPAANKEALDLLSKLLVFHPSGRLTATQALAHPFLADYACLEDEPTGPPLIPEEWAFEHDVLSKGDIQAMLLREVERFRDVPGAVLPPKSAHSVPGVVAAGAASAATRSAPPITSTTTTKGGSRADTADSATDASNVSRSGVSTSVAIDAKHNPDTAGTERWNSPRLVAHATNAASTGTFVSLPLAVAASEVQSQTSLLMQALRPTAAQVALPPSAASDLSQTEKRIAQHVASHVVDSMESFISRLERLEARVNSSEDAVSSGDSKKS